MTSYKCVDCGSKDSFDAKDTEYVQYSKEWGTQDVVIDSDGDIQDYGDVDIRDSEITDSESGHDYHEISCRNCGGEHVIDEDEEVVKPKKEKVKNWKEKMEEQNG